MHAATFSTANLAGTSESRLIRRLAAATLLMTLLPLPAAGSGTSNDTMLSVIVRATGEGARAAASAIVDLGGTVGRGLPIINGFTADIPASSLEQLSSTSGVAAVTIDGKVRPMTATDDYFESALVNNTTATATESSGTSSGSNATTDTGTMSNVAQIVNAHKMWNNGLTGRGVDVALIDTGVAPVQGIQASQLIDGPDLSFDSQSGVLYLDQYGHGTHMAGIIAGRQDGVSAESGGCKTCLNGSGFSDTTKFVGIAPEARIVNVKVGAFDGATDVSQVIAAIDWVVQHRNDNGMNIRVLNLSFGTDSAQSYVLDPLAYAAEVAWRHGIFVAAASGNEGPDATELATPAKDPFLFAVGAANPNSTLKLDDDTVPDWVQRGSLQRPVDVMAPGVSVASLDVPGSFVNLNEETVHSGSYLRGSGTSQATAVASGVAALMFQKYPDATPDQVKAALLLNARPLQSAPGATMLDAWKASRGDTLPAVPAQPYSYSNGTGSLEAARGSIHVEADGVVLEGEIDIFGNAWDGQRWSADAFAGTSWYGGLWNGQRWSGDGWEGQRWSGQRWSSDMWNGQRWSGQRWSDMTWDGQRWSGTGWDGQRWSGQRWSGQRWSSQRWSSQRWSSSTWS